MDSFTFVMMEIALLVLLVCCLYLLSELRKLERWRYDIEIRLQEHRNDRIDAEHRLQSQIQMARRGAVQPRTPPIERDTLGNRIRAAEALGFEPNPCINCGSFTINSAKGFRACTTCGEVQMT